MIVSDTDVGAGLPELYVGARAGVSVDASRTVSLEVTAGADAIYAGSWVSRFAFDVGARW